MERRHQRTFLFIFLMDGWMVLMRRQPACWCRPPAWAMGTLSPIVNQTQHHRRSPRLARRSSVRCPREKSCKRAVSGTIGRSECAWEMQEWEGGQGRETVTERAAGSARTGRVKSVFVILFQLLFE